MSSLSGNSFRWPSVFMTLNVYQPGCVATFAKMKVHFFFLYLVVSFYFGGFGVVVGGEGVLVLFLFSRTLRTDFAVDTWK